LGTLVTMIDTVQFVLLLVIIILTVLLLVLGIQVFFILKELRQTLGKANKVLDNAESITHNITGPISHFSSISSGLKAGSFITAIKIVKGILTKDRDEEDNRHHTK
jgi:Na+/proline symporter